MISKGMDHSWNRCLSHHVDPVTAALIITRTEKTPTRAHREKERVPQKALRAYKREKKVRGRDGNEGGKTQARWWRLWWWAQRRWRMMIPLRCAHAMRVGQLFFILIFLSLLIILKPSNFFFILCSVSSTTQYSQGKERMVKFVELFGVASWNDNDSNVDVNWDASHHRYSPYKHNIGNNDWDHDNNSFNDAGVNRRATRSQCWDLQIEKCEKRMKTWWKWSSESSGAVSLVSHCFSCLCDFL